MIEWTDLGVILSVRKYGENDIIMHALTENHGHHAGVIKGGNTRKRKGMYQQGNHLHLRWRARLLDHLGTFVCEPERMFAAGVLHDKKLLIALSALCATAEMVLPEREVHSLAYRQVHHLLDTLGDRSWTTDYVLWEMHLLNELGFGLDLSSCAATGELEELIYVSPRSGRAVSREAGIPYKNQLLTLPLFLTKEIEGIPPKEDVAAGLDLTGYFLERHVLAQHHRSLPDARARRRNMVVC